jgi:probable HAF family extracellular repeat protein
MDKKCLMFALTVALAGFAILVRLDAQERRDEAPHYKVADISTLQGPASGVDPQSALGSGSSVPANAMDERWPRRRHPRYRLIDIGTLDGPNSNTALGFFQGAVVPSLSHSGRFAGQADTSTPDPFRPACFNPNCYVSHAITWKDGVTTDLGALPKLAGLSSASTWISTNGLIAGFSENGEVDPFTGGPSVHGVLWKEGEIKDLGTLKGGFESVATAVNARGEIVGFANNSTPDPDSLVGFGSQTRAVVWRNGKIHDLGTLGGSDAVALYINDWGQIAGQSYTSSSIPPPTPSCTDFPLTLHGFYWTDGKMVDLQTLGGNCTFAYALNNRGQIVGQSTLVGDHTSHPYLWEKGKMRDLGGLGGDYGFAVWLNEAGEVVGTATGPSEQALLAFLWKDGAMSNLGTLAGNSCSAANAINSKGQIVGGSGFRAVPFFPACTDTVEHAVLWEDGHIYDLNFVLTTKSDLILNEATFINGHGEITGFGTTTTGDTHAFVLIPCVPDTSDGCDDDAASEVSSATGINTPLLGPPDELAVQVNRMRERLVTGSYLRLTPARNSFVSAKSTPYDVTGNTLNSYQISLQWQEAAGQKQNGFNVYRCHGCSNPRTQGTKTATVGPSVLTYLDGTGTSPLTEATSYTYQVTAFTSNSESMPSNLMSATTRVEPGPTNLWSSAFVRGGFDEIVRLGWTNNSTDDDSYFLESCVGSACTNFSVVAQLPANTVTCYRFFQFAAGRTIRYRVRAHSPGGFSSYSNVRNQTLP